MKKYNDFINEADMGIYNAYLARIDLTKVNPYNNNNLEDLSLKEIGKQGKLAEYINQGNVIKFGMLKAIYHDAVVYKKKREYTKGAAKFTLRAIPLALSPVFFPIWLFAQIFGGARAINKILMPTLSLNHKNYNSFIKTFIKKTMSIAEGDIRPLLGKDWFYDVFYVDDGLIKMVRKEHVYEFTNFISEQIQNKPDDQIVPDFWLDNEFRKWLNNKFEIDLPTGKTMRKNKSKS